MFLFVNTKIINLFKIMGYKCAFGHTTYHPSCDACDGETSSETTGFFEDESDKKDRFKAAKRGITLREYRDLEYED